MEERIEETIALMKQFAERTGLTSERPPQRYLWTDAFAVGNFLGLAQTTGEQHYTELALRLVDQVHHTLGQHRDDDPRSGWISGLSKHDGEHHPTRGGLRIGKKLPERSADEPIDEQLEWDRDGQYFHYLTKWMHALNQVTRATQQPRFNLWARELAETAYNAFTYLPAALGPRRMYWKMNIDLTQALVPAMGQHDPLDGYITGAELITIANKLPEVDSGPKLANEISQFSTMMAEGEWATEDPLGIGGLLTDASRVNDMLQQRAVTDAHLDPHLLETLLAAALVGLQHYAQRGELRLPAEYRLAFRELGLAIGLHAVEHIWQAADSDRQPAAANAEVHAQLQALMQYMSLSDEIESFWRNPAHQRTHSWAEHRDINEVMLATSLGRFL